MPKRGFINIALQYIVNKIASPFFVLSRLLWEQINKRRQDSSRGASTESKPNGQEYDRLEFLHSSGNNGPGAYGYLRRNENSNNPARLPAGHPNKIHMILYLQDLGNQMLITI